mmetsp:Transcript_25644/g.49936  ORF Transcript_25644/g.49936 Transcript_25644/m.49936 type:complete len:213 (+) Transcript_25644:3-641(+)
MCKAGQTLDDLRALPSTFTELGENQMSDFAAMCKAVGLDELFMTLMKKKPDSKESRIGVETASADTRKWWVSGEPLTDRKSVFQAHLALVNSRNDVQAALACLKNVPAVRKIAKATHNIMAYRFPSIGSSFIKDCDDDGETAAGGRLLHLLDLTGASGVLVVVSRWYGGIHLGPDRFRHINNVARKLLVSEGVIRSESNAGVGKRSRNSKQK